MLLAKSCLTPDLPPLTDAQSSAHALGQCLLPPHPSTRPLEDPSPGQEGHSPGLKVIPPGTLAKRRQAPAVRVSLMADGQMADVVCAHESRAPGPGAAGGTHRAAGIHMGQCCGLAALREPSGGEVGAAGSGLGCAPQQHQAGGLCARQTHTPAGGARTVQTRGCKLFYPRHRCVCSKAPWCQRSGSAQPSVPRRTARLQRAPGEGSAETGWQESLGSTQCLGNCSRHPGWPGQLPMRCSTPWVTHH